MCIRDRCTTIRTNPHDHQKPGQEPPQLHHTAGPALHEVILALSFATQPIRYGSDHVGRYDEKGEEVLEEGGAEDDEEEADGEDLRIDMVSVVPADGDRAMFWRTKERTMMVLRPAMAMRGGGRRSGER